MKITGKFFSDGNFITVCCDNTVYTIARSTGDWGTVEVGQRTAMGGIFTQEMYDELLSRCEKEGSFELSE